MEFNNDYIEQKGDNMLSVDELTKYAELYGIEVNQVEKSSGEIFFIDSDGNKAKINPEDFTEDMKSIDFMMAHGFIVADKLVGQFVIKGDLDEDNIS